MAGTGRSKGFRITQSQRLKFAQKIRALLTKNPSLSREELVNLTGAPFDMTNFIKRRFREEQARERVAARAHVVHVPAT